MAGDDASIIYYKKTQKIARTISLFLVYYYIILIYIIFSI